MSVKDDIYNDIMADYHVSDAYDRWKEYREHLTSYIIEHTEPGNTIAILGAGESNDIDLEKLYNHLGNLTLVDKDKKSVEKALKKYGLNDKENVRIVCTDFLGINESDYKDLISVCLRGLKSPMGFSPFATGPACINKMQEIFEGINKREISFGIEQHDYIVSVGVHSQLFALFEVIWNNVLRAVNKKYDKVSECNHKQFDLYSPRFTEKIIEYSRKKAFIGLEIMEYNLSYPKGTTVQGACQAAQYITESIPEDELVAFQIMWPLKETCSYYMFVYRIEK